MKQLTQEWINKAEGDFQTAQREINVLKLPNYDAVCFHSQQSVEKYLKAILQENNIIFGKTHDLTILLNLLLSIHPAWENLRPALIRLTVYSVEFRYPGESANKAIAEEEFEDCCDLRQVIRQNFGLLEPYLEAEGLVEVIDQFTEDRPDD